jgi:hypothetical protein
MRRMRELVLNGATVGVTVLALALGIVRIKEFFFPKRAGPRPPPRREQLEGLRGEGSSHWT